MPASLEHKRHSLAHIMAQAMLELIPEAQMAIGPAIENGFYYDFDLPRTLVPEDLPIIEEKMRRIIRETQSFEGREENIDDAITFWRAANQPYKVEIAQDLKKEGATKVSLYKNGPYIDLCRGGHVGNTEEIDAHSFKLVSIAGAYWRGDEKKKMLQRVYGWAFETNAELKAYAAMMEEAKKRDHKVLGQKLQLFTFSELVGSGLPLFYPKGAMVKDLLGAYIRRLKEKRGYSFVAIPHIASRKLYEKSGHMGKYDAMMPVMKDDDGDELVMKAMNCPHHFELYRSVPHSYRELPLRYAENTTCYRNEKSGELSGLLRVKSLTQDDTHHFIREDQIESEIQMVIGLMEEVYKKFGFNEFKVEISVRDQKNKEKYFGTDELWEKAESKLIEIVKKWGADYSVEEGEAAFYGPKIDVRVKDAIGRTWQLTTVQLDFNQPNNFDLTYVGEDGNKHRPVVIHVAILGSIERFLGVLIEHYAGAFPLWLAPEQVRILPVSDKFIDYARGVEQKLKDANIRVIVDDDTESLGKKIRNAELMKIPHILVVGEKEAAENTVTVRDFATKEQKGMGVEEYLESVKSL